MTRLDIYVTSGCTNCRYAREVAASVVQAFPSIQVRVLELSSLDEVPEEVFATPTYLLDNKVISLGNPDPAELFALIRQAGTP